MWLGDFDLSRGSVGYQVEIRNPEGGAFLGDACSDPEHESGDSAPGAERRGLAWAPQLGCQSLFQRSRRSLALSASSEYGYSFTTRSR